MKTGKMLIGAGVVAAGTAALYYIFRRPKVDDKLIQAKASPQGVEPPVDNATMPIVADEPVIVVAVPPATSTLQQTQNVATFTAKPAGPKGMVQYVTMGELANFVETEARKPSHPTDLDKWVDQYILQLDNSSHIKEVIEG